MSGKSFCPCVQHEFEVGRSCRKVRVHMFLGIYDVWMSLRVTCVDLVFVEDTALILFSGCGCKHIGSCRIKDAPVACTACPRNSCVPYKSCFEKKKSLMLELLTTTCQKRRFT